ncbi:MAG: hypothetical protein GY823_01680 [Flavobacteriaceae bacterium]|nr:hypothetical protein [Flavobacteriaceae bacterium]
MKIINEILDFLKQNSKEEIQNQNLMRVLIHEEFLGKGKKIKMGGKLNKILKKNKILI